MAKQRFDLTGQRALVTGGGRGLGAALARGLAEQGADVVIVARSAGQLQKTAAEIAQATGTRVTPLAWDLADPERASDCWSAAVADAGPIDILVNCAGINLRAPAEELSLADWRAVQDVNATAPFLLSQAFCRHRQAAPGGGRIINICSLMCRAARPTTAAYGAAKMALLGLTRSLAVEWARYGITVNAIAPGYFQTEMTAPLYEQAAFDGWVRERTPLGRWGDPEDLVGAAVLLASAAGAYITGQIIYVDGGWSAAL